MGKTIGGKAGSSPNKTIQGQQGNGPKRNTSVNSSQSNQTSSSDCFVATAAFETPLANEIYVLRNFRDQTLRYSSFGRSFISVYYSYGPYIARFIDKHPIFKKPIRILIKASIKLGKR